MKRKFISGCVILLFIFAAVVSAYASADYSITYDYGVASTNEHKIINRNPDSAAENESISLTSPECEGFEFIGWYLESDYRTPVTSLTVTSDTTVYAKWYEMSYSINYVLTTDGIPLSASEVTNSNPHIRVASEEVILSAPQSVYDRFTFEGWYTDENYTEKIEIINAGTCSDITLYAHWVNTQFNIFYELGSVANSVYTTENPNPSVYTYGKSTTILPATTNDPAFSFEGWYSDEFFTQRIENISDKTSGDITLYANWNKTVYNIEYVLNSGCDIDIADIENSNETTRTSDTDFILNAPVTNDKSYVFAGWYSSPDFEKSSAISKIKAGFNDNITLYAKWESAVYRIEYNYSNIDTYQCPVDNSNPDTYLYGDVITLAPLDIDGFIFNGWCTDYNLKNPITQISADMYGDITLYADITEKTYTITYVLADKEVTENQVGNTNANFRTTTERFYFDEPETINVDYSFGGWYFDAEFTQKADFIKAYTTGNITVYAKWIKNVSYIPEWGDASLSDLLTPADARLILRHAAKLETFTELQKQVSDLNNDSVITPADARLALRLAANLESTETLTAKFNLPEIQLSEGEIIFVKKDS